MKVEIYQLFCGDYKLQKEIYNVDFILNKSRATHVQLTFIKLKARPKENSKLTGFGILPTSSNSKWILGGSTSDENNSSSISSHRMPQTHKKLQIHTIQNLQ